MKKKMIIIGGSISGIYLSILLKKYLDIDVAVLEANDKPLKKLQVKDIFQCCILRAFPLSFLFVLGRAWNMLSASFNIVEVFS